MPTPCTTISPRGLHSATVKSIKSRTSGEYAVATTTLAISSVTLPRPCSTTELVIGSRLDSSERASRAEALCFIARSVVTGRSGAVVILNLIVPRSHGPGLAHYVVQSGFLSSLT